MKHSSPVDPDQYIGTITFVSASQAQANLPYATARPEKRGLARGAVGDFVFVDCERVKLLGRIIEVKIPDAERLSVEPQLGTPIIPHPIGRIQILATVAQGENKLTRGIKSYPRIGDGVYLASAALLAEMIGKSVAKEGELSLAIGRIDAAGDGVEIRLPPEKIFGRHCGVLGATGGGKSWTIAMLLQQIQTARGKAIIFDPTGEFSKIRGINPVFSFAESTVSTATHVHFPYRHATEDDIFSLFRPSGQSQGPKLREAIKSLKLVQALNVNGSIPNGLTCSNGAIEKNGKTKKPYSDAMKTHAQTVHSQNCDFDIENLAAQIVNECIYPSDRYDPSKFGGPDSSLGYCDTLIARIGSLAHSKELECIFKTNGASLVEEIDKFLRDDTKDIALISFKEIRFEHNTREILLNVIGRYLLGLARSGRFKESPIVVFLDEAHQFLGRTVGDEYGSVRLDSFGLIAKEGRKYGLTCVLATQRPRDIPQDVLSQLGTLFVHRLTNDQDRETVERACGDLDRAAAQFIPMLAPGEAILIGPDLPAPVPIKIIPPVSPPDSKGPPFQQYWRSRATTKGNGTATATIQVSSNPPETSSLSEVTDDEIPF
ncbi:MAG: ATP-binding protein [Nitrosomonas sp.]|nr:ATP-binding protein [Nitrosomonas sp.]UJP00082.1 MAG: ATP-binding protein [Nitrosomonas sp.]